MSPGVAAGSVADELLTIEGLRLVAFGSLVVGEFTRPLTSEALTQMQDAVDRHRLQVPQLALLDIINTAEISTTPPRVRDEAIEITRRFIRQGGTIAVVMFGTGLGYTISTAALKYALFASRDLRVFTSVTPAYEWLQKRAGTVNDVSVQTVLRHFNL